MTETRELAYKRKAKLRKKHRKVRAELVSEMVNLQMAVKKSRKGKEGKRSVSNFDKDYDENLKRLQKSLIEGSYHTSKGNVFDRKCPCGKVRKLLVLPYYPDNIEQHALMQILMPHLDKALYKESGASVKGRGTMYAKRRTERWIDEKKSCGRIYFIKLDFIKFYENVDQQVLYNALCNFFSNKGIRYLLQQVIFAQEKGLGIGLYPIQTLTNYYMSILCRTVSMLYDVKVEIYCDDMVILGSNKKDVWKAVNFILDYAHNVMHQELHSNIGMQIADYKHFLDYVGYRFYFNHTELRKRMKENFKKKMHNLKDPMRKYRVAMSYKGWLLHCDGFNLWRKITGMDSFDDFKMPIFDERDADGKRIFQGRKGNIGMILNQPIIILDVEFGVRSQYGKKGVTNLIQLQCGGITYKVRSNNSYLDKQLRWFVENKHIPLKGWKFINWNMTGVGNPDYRIVRSDWTPEIGF